MKHCDACAQKITLRGSEEKKAMLNRLKRIEGQVRGVQTMVEEDAYCPDILIQVQAIRQALNAFNQRLLLRHMETCVKDGFEKGDESTVEELTHVLARLLK